MGETRWLTDGEQTTWRAFMRASRLFFAQIDRELQQEAGMPTAYYEILAMLSEAPDRTLRMSELADTLTSSRSRLSHAVARLEQNGWVQRVSCDTDKRGSFAVLTDEGFRVLEAAAPIHVEGIRTHLFDQLTPEQSEQLGAISEAVKNHLQPYCPKGEEDSE